LKLRGDFDGSSALELINALSAECAGINKFIIDTSDLSAIHSFGRAVFRTKIGARQGRYLGLIFIGTHRHLFAP
jgi:anti-anti-sigma regulatory factor